MLKSDVHHLWQKLLDENECLRNSFLLYPPDKQASLIQQRDKLFSAINQLFKKPSESISSSFELNCTIICSSSLNNSKDDFKHGFIKNSNFVDESKKQDLMAIATGGQECLILQFDNKFTAMKCFKLQLTSSPFTHNLLNGAIDLKFVDLHFYNADIISLLLRNNSDEKPRSFLIQFSLDRIAGKHSTHILEQTIVDVSNQCMANNFFDVIDRSGLKGIDNICTKLAVSGSRKVIINKMLTHESAIKYVCM